MKGAFMMMIIIINVWKVSKYGVFSGPYFPACGLNTDQKKLRIWTLFTQCYDDELHPKEILTPRKPGTPVTQATPPVILYLPPERSTQGHSELFQMHHQEAWSTLTDRRPVKIYTVFTQ